MNWDNQWKLFAPDFRNGKAHIDLTPYGHTSTLELYPGPGFGDFSHPTTRLVLKLMAPHVKDRPVIDIGCGSGILSLAAAAMGATSVYGYDIDPEAVEHAKKNLNLLPESKNVTFALDPPRMISSKTVFLLNMISSEQRQAWESLPDQIPSGTTLITSGVLLEEQKEYLDWRTSQRFQFKETENQEGWVGFIFTHL